MNDILQISILFIIVFGGILYINTVFTTIEGLSYNNVNKEIIAYAQESNAKRTNFDRKSIVCCANNTYAPTAKCVKQIDQNTCILPMSDGTCSDNINYDNEGIVNINNGSNVEACKIPKSNGTYVTSSQSTNPVPVSVDTLNASLLTPTDSNKSDIKLGDKISFKYNKWIYDGYVTSIVGNEYTVEYEDGLETKTAEIKKKSIKSWESGKIYLENLLYNETYGPNSYAFYSNETKKCCFDAPKKSLSSIDSSASPPEKYQCPIGWDLVTNLCTDNCSPCTSGTNNTPKSVTYPNKIKSVMSLEDGYVYRNNIDNSGDEQVGIHTLVSAPFLL
tara:strand:- start:348 stop:1343 length:996 start_codon:yes stop_codon:yes gene_type:complete